MLSAETVPSESGWLPGAPPHVGRDVQAIDRSVLRRACCEECGHKGLRYTPQQKGRRYRALAVCPACGATAEF
jgi:hypothetical protein